MSLNNQAWVFNCDYNGLSIIQALGRNGVDVYALDPRRSIGTHSRYASFQKVPDPLVDENGFIQALYRIRTSVDANPVLMPTNDHWAEVISKHQQDLSEKFHCCVCDFQTISILLDKERFGRWGQSLDLPVPKVWTAEEALNDAELPFPVAVKANARRKTGQGAAWARAADKLRFRPCADRAELQALLKEAEQASVPVFIQQLVHGRSDAMRTIGLFAKDGHIHGLVYGRKLRGFPPGFGDCIVGLAEPVPAWAMALAEKICSNLSYTGFAEIELMQDAKTGEHYLIEINPRSWSWVGVAAPAGVDLAKIAYECLALGKAPEQTVIGCADGRSIYYAKVLADLQNSLLWYRFTDAKDWVLSPRQWWKTFSSRKGVFAELASDDPKIAFFSVLISLKQSAGKLKNVFKKRSL